MHRILWEAVELPYYLLLSRSITHAQRMQIVLGKKGISCRILRPPVGLTDKGCSYAIRVAEKNYSEALYFLREENILPMRIFLVAEDGAFREVYL